MPDFKLPDFKIPSNIMLKAGQLAISLMRKSLYDGILADGSTKHYRSRQYMKYKANAMRRFTKDVKFKTKETQFGSGLFDVKSKGEIKKTAKGGKLSGFGTRSINTDVSKVNLTLTGDMVKSLQAVNAQINRVHITFGSEQAQKVLGNIKHGYNPVGLNDKDTQQVKNMLVAHLNSTKPNGTFSYKIGS